MSQEQSCWVCSICGLAWRSKKGRQRCEAQGKPTPEFFAGERVEVFVEGSWFPATVAQSVASVGIDRDGHCLLYHILFSRETALQILENDAGMCLLHTPDTPRLFPLEKIRRSSV